MKMSDRFCQLFSEYHKKFPSGGFLHTVTDDGNWETKNIVWSLMHWQDYRTDEEKEWIEKHEEEIIEMCSYMLELTEKQRFKIWDNVRRCRNE